MEIRSNTELPSLREEIELVTPDGQRLVGELSLPVGKLPIATLITLHPLPTHGGFMDSHLLRKMANRLPEQLSVAVLRFNTRGTESPRGKSTGTFDGGEDERFDVEAAVRFCEERKLPRLWLVGWSFGTELAIKYGPDYDIEGAILLSPPLHRATDADLLRWQDTRAKLIALVPELDEFLNPAQATERFSILPKAKLLAFDGEKHLWVGESATRRVFNAIAEEIVPGSSPLPTEY
ncbi:MAG: alpha/beta hydrolase [Aquiluna sp.]|jgi:alpha/beta superfamily hydrolase